MCLNKKKSYAGLLAVALVPLLPLPVHAFDSAAIEVGRGYGVDMFRVALQSRWDKTWSTGGGWQVGGYWDVAVGRWHQNSVLPGQNSSLINLGVTPTFRFESDSGRGLYAEGGIGAQALTHTSIGARRFGTGFQFGSIVGGGMRFGPRQALDIGVRVQHISNGSIKSPNNGMNFTQMRLQYHF